MDLLSFQKAYTRSLEYYDKGKLDEAIQEIKPVTDKLNLHDYMLLKQPVIPKALVVECLYNLGVMYKEKTEKNVRSQTDSTTIEITQEDVNNFQVAMNYFKKVLSIQPEHDNSLTNIVSILTILCSYFSEDYNLCIGYLQECLFYQPTNYTIHYNLGLTYQKTNKLENSIIHYKLSIELCKNLSKNETELKNNLINCLFGISSVYCSIKEWSTALQFLIQGLKINPKDPDINNQLGIVYTELRRTDLAVTVYNTALNNYKNSVVTTNYNKLLSNIYVNMGHMCSYNGSPSLSIEMYNRSLAVNSKSVFALQNKLLNLNYVDSNNQNSLENHKLINQIYPKKLTFNYPSLPNVEENEKINIGFVSADFVDHPVSYFVQPLLKGLNRSKFNIFCYSENMLDKNKMFSDLHLRVIKHKPTQDVCELIQNDKIHILFDLSGHTAGNRLDVFSQKPAPIQISYIGYPNTTGLDSMDYRITDNYCDDNQDQFSETLLKLDDSFLCYDPFVTPQITDQQPILKNGYITFGCFNRLNKISDSVINVCKSLLDTVPNSQFIFKTKALMNKKVRETFLTKFGKNAERVKILDCTNTHNEHLVVYNEVDISIDTFPYSGTTTSCESLLMGVPVLTLFKQHLHSNNVTSSLLKNSDLDFYVCHSQEDFTDKVSTLLGYDTNTFWKNLKKDTREKFLSGKVCNQENFIKNFENALFKTLESNKQ